MPGAVDVGVCGEVRMRRKGIKCPKCKRAMRDAGRVMFEDEIIKTYYCQRCDKFWRATYDVVLRGMEEVEVRRDEK